MLNGKPFYSNGSFTLPEMDSGTAGTQEIGGWDTSQSLCNVNMFYIVQCNHWVRNPNPSPSPST